MRILRLVRMVKVIRYSKILNQYSELLQISQGFQRLFKTAGLMLFMIHMTACMWFLVAVMDTRVTWIVGAGILDATPEY